MYRPYYINITVGQVYYEITDRLRLSNAEMPLDYNEFCLYLDLSLKDVYRYLFATNQWANIKVIYIDFPLSNWLDELRIGYSIPSDYIHWKSLTLYKRDGDEKTIPIEARYTNIKEFMELAYGYAGNKRNGNIAASQKADIMQPIFTVWGLEKQEIEKKGGFDIDKLLEIYGADLEGIGPELQDRVRFDNWRVNILFYYPRNMYGQFRYHATPFFKQDISSGKLSMDEELEIPADMYNVLINLIIEKLCTKYGLTRYIEKVIKMNAEYINRTDILYTSFMQNRRLEEKKTYGINMIAENSGINQEEENNDNK